MRKSLVALIAVAVMVLLGTSAAKASVVQISLGPSTSATTFQFASGSPSTTVTLTLDDVVGPASTIPSTNTFAYTLAGPPPGNGPDTVTLTADGGGYYTASNTPISVFITDGSGDTLTGTLTLVDLQQASTFGLVNFLPTITANLTITGATGTLAGFQSAGSGSLPIVLTLGSATAINDLDGTESASLLAGTITPSPEPRSMLLFGSGLFLVGAFIRRQLRA